VATDPLGKRVEMSEAAWSHALAHPQRSFLAGHEEQARLTVEDPDVCTREKDGSINYYRRGTLARYGDMYLHVVARPAGENGLRVHTVWPSPSIDPCEEYLWLRGMTK
jgi:hypothetical protein